MGNTASEVLETDPDVAVAESGAAEQRQDPNEQAVRVTKRTSLGSTSPSPLRRLSTRRSVTRRTSTTTTSAKGAGMGTGVGAGGMGNGTNDDNEFTTINFTYESKSKTHTLSTETRRKKNAKMNESGNYMKKAATPAANGLTSRRSSVFARTSEKEQDDEVTRRGSLKQGQFILRRFSFQRRNSVGLGGGNESIARQLTLNRNKTLRRQQMQQQKDQERRRSVRNSVSRNRAAMFKINDEEIEQIADSRPMELHYLNFTLKKWEDIYKYLCDLYAEVNGVNNVNEMSKPTILSTKVTKWTLERALDKVSRCIETHPEYKVRQVAKWEKWEEDNKDKNMAAFIEMKNLVPENIKNMTVDDMVKELNYTKMLARRLVHKKVFHLLYMTEQEIRKVYAGDFGLKGRFDYTGLDIVELRAVYYATRCVGLTTKWRTSMRELLYELSFKEQAGSLGKYMTRHAAYQRKLSVIPKENSSSNSNSIRKDASNSVTSEGTAGDKTSFSDIDSGDEKERLTVVLRAKTKSLLYQIRNKPGKNGRPAFHGKLLSQLSRTSREDLFLGDERDADKNKGKWVLSDTSKKFNQLLKRNINMEMDSSLMSLRYNANDDDKESDSGSLLGNDEDDAEFDFEHHKAQVKNFYVSGTTTIKNKDKSRNFGPNVDNNEAQKQKEVKNRKMKPVDTTNGEDEEELEDELKGIEFLVRQLSEQADPDELEQLLASVFE